MVMAGIPLSPIKRAPKLDLLNTFERAAYYGNFTRAAHELCISQAAVSRQIGILEEQLGIKLFIRNNRGITLTPQARPLYETLHSSIEKIKQSVGRIQKREQNSQQRLSIALDSALAGTWLKQRFFQFRERHPDIQLELQLITNTTPIDTVDLQVLYLPGSALTLDKYQIELLYEPMDFVVCSPNLLTSKKPLNTLEDLNRHSLVHEFNRDIWPDWLHHMNADNVNTQAGPLVHDSLLCLEMATNCEGIILSDDLVAADYLHTGKLVKPLPHVHPGRDKVYLLNRKELSDHQGLIAFKQWIQQEMQQHLTTCENLRAFKTFQFSS